MVRALFLLLLLSAAPAAADPALCEGAARQAAAETGVPADLLVAITRVETGRDREGALRPWPWAANLEGRGHWFDTRAELALFAESVVAAGRTSVDIGCFQINWRWHGAEFARPSDLADPLTGARHAARYLLRLRDEFGSWEGATGAYHSRDPARAEGYASRVAAQRAPPAVPAASCLSVARVVNTRMVSARNRAASSACSGARSPTHSSSVR